MDLRSTNLLPQYKSSILGSSLTTLTTQKNGNLSSSISSSGLLTTKSLVLQNTTLKYSSISNTSLNGTANKDFVAKRKSIDNVSLQQYNKQQKTVASDASGYTSPFVLSSILFDPLRLSLDTKDVFPLEQNVPPVDGNLSHEPSKLKRPCESDVDVENRRLVQHKKCQRVSGALDVTALSTDSGHFDAVAYNFRLPDEQTVVQTTFSPFAEKKLTSTVRLKQKRLKVSLVNSVSSALIKGPNMKDPTDSVRLELVDLCDRVSEFDPEFILKIALYTRQELNIRTLCNLLLAYSAFNANCRSFLMRYFNKCVVLPSDWADVADQYQLFDDKSLKRGSLPSMLRKSLAAKFSEFEVYQLAKYNKKKPTKKKKERDESDSDDEDEETEEEIVRRTFTLKQLIRLLHLKDPAEYVMALIGKKYPENPEQFRASRLPGVWDQSKKGKRMKLPIPFTWETQLSLNGNNKRTWEKLIDSKKLPYMATLRNLRNILLAGVSYEHHVKVINYLTDKNAVIRSRQFPHRYMFAEEVLAQLQEQANSTPEPCPKVPAKKGCGKVRPTCVEAASIERKKQKILTKARSMLYFLTDHLFSKYRKALKTAVDIATFHNVPPINGKTILLLDTNERMNEVCRSAKGLGKAHTVKDIAKVLVNLCNSACEVLTLREFSDKRSQEDNCLVKIDESLFTPLIRDQQKVDNIIVITDSKQVDFISHFVCKYRLAVNPQVLYVTVCLAAGKNSINASGADQNDICLSGFSDNIFKFISERGNGGQLGYIDRIDVKYDLPAKKVSSNTRVLQTAVKIPTSVEMISKSTWKTVKVFISSTFIDMHGERDLLVRYVFPELRSRAKNLYIDVHEVDLRWGITKEESANSKWLEICLTEVSKCQLFIGIIGGRYGTIPPSYDIPNKNPALDWLNDYPPGASITELEFHMGALANPKENKEKAFFYIRNDSFHKDVPSSLANIFVEESEHSRKKLGSLKRKMLSSGIDTLNRYPCQWGGISAGKPMTKGLEDFGHNVLNNLWNSLLKMSHQKENNESNSTSETNNLHAEYALKHHKQFVGRARLVADCLESIRANSHNIIALEGKQGSGKTALMGHLSQLLINKCEYPVIPCFVGASTVLGYSDRILETISNEIRRITNITTELEDDQRTSIINEFHSLISEVATKIPKIVILLDGLDLLQTDQQMKALEWLNLQFPKCIVIVCSCIGGGLIYKNLARRLESKLIHLGPVNLPDRLKIIRNNFQVHGKSLDESSFNNQLQMLTLKQESSLPMYLSMVCEELRTFGAFDKLTDKIKSLSNTVEGLLDESILRLEVEFGFEIVSGMLSILAVSQNGLNEEDLYMLLNVYIRHCGNKLFCVGDVQKCFASIEDNIPRATFSLLTRALQFLLHITGQSSDGTLMLSHANISVMVRARYKKTVLSPEGERLLHHILAGYFWNLLEPKLSYKKFGCIPRALASLPVHLLASGLFAELQNLLCSLDYILAKCLAGMSEQLLSDYSYLLTMAQLSIHKFDLKILDLDKVKQFENFVSRNLNILKQFPNMTIQQACNEPRNSHVAIEANKIVQDKYRTDVPAPVYWENKPDIEDQCRLTIKLSKPASCSALSPDEKLIAIGEDISINLYDFSTGKKIKTLTGHSQEITCIAFLNQSKMCSGSQDGAIVVWNIDAGNKISHTKAHQRRVAALSCNNSTLSFVSVSWDATIKIWQSSNGDLISTIEPDKTKKRGTQKWSPISCMSFHPTKQLIVTGSWDSNLRIFDMESYKLSAVLHGHSASLYSVCISPNGRLVCSTSWDSTIKLWSLNHGFQIASISSLNPFTDVKFTPCGTHFISGNVDKTVSLYSAHVGKIVNTFKATRNARVTCVSLFNVDTIVCGYQDGYAQTIKTSTGEEKNSVKCGTAQVTCIFSVYMHGVKMIVLGMLDGKLVALDVDCEIKYVLLGHSSAITALVCRYGVVISGSENGCIAAHTINTYTFDRQSIKECQLEPINKWLAHDGSVSSISNKWDFSYFATTGADQTLKLWSYDDFVDRYDASNSEVVTPSLTIDTSHVGSIRASCWVMEPKRSVPLVITTANDLTMVAWNSVTGEKSWTLSDFNAPITYLLAHKHVVIGCSLDGTVYAWSSCGKKLTSVKGDGENLFCGYFKAKLLESPWNNEDDSEGEDNNKVKKMIPAEFLTALAESMNFVYVARYQTSGIIQIVQPCLGDVKETLVGHSNGILSLSCGLKGRLVTTSLDGTIKFWTTKCFAAHIEPDNNIRHHSEVSCVFYCNTKHIVLTGDRSGYVLVWTNVMDKWQAISRTKAHKKAVTGLMTLENGSLISTVSNDQMLKVWTLIKTDGIHTRNSALPKKLLNIINEASPLMEYKLRLETKTELPHPITCFDYSHLTSTFFVGLANVFIYSYALKKQNLEKPILSRISELRQNEEPMTDEVVIEPYTTHMKLIEDQQGQYIILTNSLGDIKAWKNSSGQNEVFDIANINERDPENSEGLEVWKRLARVCPSAIDICKRTFGNGECPTDMAVGLHDGRLMSIVLNPKYGSASNDTSDNPYSCSLITFEKMQNSVRGMAFVTLQNDEQLTVCLSEDDGSLKIYESNQGSPYKQVTQFFCSSSVNCISAVEQPDGDSTLVICGDLIGNVYFLNVKSNVK